ncbi:hypothetical protein NKG05_14605 [Oerskovia sp. M15]
MRVVEDPDPQGRPARCVPPRSRGRRSPGRRTTWCSRTTSPRGGFAEHVHHAVRNRDRHALALYTNWNSPHNAYLVRSAAVSGQVWAPLGHHEWVPTLGLVLPADAARRLAEHLATFPDDYRDDDEAVVTFCAKEGYPVVATVPHLLEHGSGPSLAGNASHGPRHATVPAGARVLPVDRWSTPARTPSLAAVGGPEPGGGRAARLPVHGPGAAPARRRTLEHPFGWDWADWAWWLGADPQGVATAVADLPVPAGAAHLPGRLRTEVGAAAFLLGFDAAHTAWPDGAPTDAGAARGTALPGDAERDSAIRTWVQSGLAARTRRPSSASPTTPQHRPTTRRQRPRGARRVRAVGAGRGCPRRDGNDGRDGRSGGVLGRCRPRRRADGRGRHGPGAQGGPHPDRWGRHAPPTDVELVTCPWCGTRGEQVLDGLVARHSAGGAVRYGSAPAPRPRRIGRRLPPGAPDRPRTPADAGLRGAHRPRVPRPGPARCGALSHPRGPPDRPPARRRRPPVSWRGAGGPARAGPCRAGMVGRPGNPATGLPESCRSPPGQDPWPPSSACRTSPQVPGGRSGGPRAHLP